MGLHRRINRTYGIGITSFSHVYNLGVTAVLTNLWSNDINTSRVCFHCNQCINTKLVPLFHFHSFFSLIIYTPDLPLRLLPLQKPLQHRNNFLQTSKPHPQLTHNLLLILAQLDIEILPVRTRAHRGAEDGLHHEGVVRFQRVAVGGAEGGGELVGAGCDVLG